MKSLGRHLIVELFDCDRGLLDDLEAMQRYQVHPEHLKVVAIVKRICAAVLAVDFNYD